MNIQAKRALGFGVAHFLVLSMCYVTAVALRMDRFDKDDLNEGAAEYVAASLANILMAPGKYIWTPWASKNLHDAFEWLLIIANSALWGVALAYVYGRLRKTT